MATLEELRAVVSKRRLDCLQILHEDFHFNENEFREQVYDYNPILCKFVFSELLGEPFDISNDGQRIRLLDLPKSSNDICAQLLYFFMHTFEHTIRLQPQPIIRKKHTSKKAKASKEFAARQSLPNLHRTKPHPDNPFRRGAILHWLFEHLLRYPGGPDEWAQYAHRVLAERISVYRKTKSRTPTYVHLSILKRRLREYRMTIAISKDVPPRLVITKNKKVLHG